MNRYNRRCRAWQVFVIGAGLLAGSAGITYGQEGKQIAGPWKGEVHFTIEGTPQTADIHFTLNPSGQISDGVIGLEFTYSGISDTVLTSMKEHHCLITFNELSATSRPVAGLFASSQAAAGIFDATGCQLDGVGTLQFVTPVSGTWSAAPDITQNTSPSTGEAVSPYDPPTHPNDALNGRALYKLHCQECHAQMGLGSEKAPPLEGLNAQLIADTVREGPEKMGAFTHEELPDRQLNTLIDYILRFHPDSKPRTEFIITPPNTDTN